jgi:hypothetical protein
MAAIDGATKSLMQGVSQQVARERLDGQVSLQSNMLSDVVEGMRRRPGMRMLTSGAFGGGALWGKDQMYATSIDIDDTSVHVLVNTQWGTVALYADDMTLLTAQTNAYLAAPDASSIQVAALRGYLYICNTSVAPIKVVDNSQRIDPDKTGFFFVKTGQYSKIYNITVTINGTPYTVTYTAPDGTTAGDAAKATPEYIANRLLTSLSALAIPNLGIDFTGAYVFLQNNGAGVLSVTTDSGSTYIGVSNASHVAQVSDLPARLPASGGKSMVSVGSNPKLSIWYTYNYATNTWVESGAYGSATSITGMPLRLKLDNTYALSYPTYEGRLAGNDDTNEDPAFLTEGISGMSVFQGRLVLLAGPNVCMSAAGKPLRWWRSTVTELLVVDPISIYSGAATSTNFTHAVQFNKDLLLFSKSCQAVVPSGNAIVSPSTAQIVITSSYSCTSKTSPIVAGRSLMYFAPRSEKFASVLELVPSNTTDSQYTTNDITAHLPRYMPGTIRQATASTTSNSLVLVCDGDARTLFVQEYLWSGDEKAQSAWHAWTSPYDIVCTWFIRDTVFIGLLINNALTICSVDTQAGSTVNGLYRPFSDLFQPVTVTGGEFAVPAMLRPAYTAGAALQLTYSAGDAAGDAVGFEVNTTTWTGTVVRNVPDGTYMVGLKFQSAFSPTQPLMRDQSGVVISTAASMLIRYELTLKNTGEFYAVVQNQGVTSSEGTYSGLLYGSNDLLPNHATYAQSSRVIVPIRIPTEDAALFMYADDDHDMGILTIEWVMQYHQRRRRA